VPEVCFDVPLDHPADRVWTALTDRDLLGRWFLPTDLTPESGSAFRMTSGARLGLPDAFTGEVFDTSPGRHLAMTWTNGEVPANVAWELTDRDGGCLLTVTQDGWVPDSPAYRSAYTEALPAVLAGSGRRRLYTLLACLLALLLLAGGLLWWHGSGTGPAVASATAPPSRFGAAGGAGPAGPAGSPGASGAAGVPGAPGIPGAPGVPGKPGATGPAGATGASGQPGAPGAPAPSLGPGSAPPASGVAAPPAGSAAPGAPDPTGTTAGSTGTSVTAVYVTVSVSTTGYQGRITLTTLLNLSVTSWTLVLTLPAGTTVTSSSASFHQSGTTVTFTPASGSLVLPGIASSFTFRTQGTGRPTGCLIGTLVCTGL